MLAKIIDLLEIYMKITIIGNNANNGIISDGGRIKIRLFKSILLREHFDVEIIELDGWKKRPFKIINLIKKAIKQGNRIIIMAGPNGCRKIIPIVCFLNRKKRANVVFCPLGIGTLDYVVRKYKTEVTQIFLNGTINIKEKDARMGKLLSKMEHVVLQNNTLKNRYDSFYNLSNTCVLENFRDCVIENKNYSSEKDLKVVYISRVKEYKGILDLMEVIKNINLEKNNAIKLDIFGDNQLSDVSNQLFNSYLDSNIKYFGVIGHDEIAKTLKCYDLFCLPTKYHGEGTSGSLVEALISGTPVLVSSYSQARDLITDCEDGFLFEFGSKKDLKEKLLWLLQNKELLESVGHCAQNRAKKFTYEGNRDIFLNIFTGDNL